MMSFWTDSVISVPRVTFRKLEELVEEVVYMEAGDEMGSRDRKTMAEELAVNVLNQYVDQYFGEGARSAAEMFLNRKRQQRLL